MKTNRIMRLLFTLLLVFLMTGCKKNVGTPEDNPVVEEEEAQEKETEEKEDRLVFGYSCIDLENPFYETLKNAIETELEASHGELIVKDASYDVEKQIAQIRELIEEDVAAVFLCPADWEKITPALEELKDAGIPVINLDTEVKAGSFTDAFIGSDNRNAGYVCGADLHERRPEGGRLILVESPGINSINERITGFEEAIANKGFEVICRIVDRKNSGNVKEEMRNLLAEGAKPDAVMCGNDRMAVQVLEALEETGGQDVLVYSVDGSPEIKTALADAQSPMAGAGAQSPINMGKAAAKTALAILNGDDYEKKVYKETFLINRDNVEMYGTDGWQ